MKPVVLVGLLGLACGMAQAMPASTEKNGGVFSVHCAQAVEKRAQNPDGHDRFEILRVVPVIADSRQFACVVRGQRIHPGKGGKAEPRLWLFGMRLNETGGADIEPTSSWSEIPIVR